jgi:hypothetical protein
MGGGGHLNKIIYLYIYLYIYLFIYIYIIFIYLFIYFIFWDNFGIIFHSFHIMF